jgi:hypothetical protein
MPLDGGMLANASFEETLPHERSDSPAGVRDLEEAVVGVNADTQTDVAPLRRILLGVGEQVAEHLVMLAGISVDPDGVIGKLKRERLLVPGEDPLPVLGGFSADGDEFAAPGGRCRHEGGETLLGELIGKSNLPLEVDEQLEGVGGVEDLLQLLGGVKHGDQVVAQVVGDLSQALAQRFSLLMVAVGALLLEIGGERAGFEKGLFQHLGRCLAESLEGKGVGGRSPALARSKYDQGVGASEMLDAKDLRRLEAAPRGAPRIMRAPPREFAAARRRSSRIGDLDGLLIAGDEVDQDVSGSARLPEDGGGALEEVRKIAGLAN